MPWRVDSAPEFRKGGFCVTEHSLSGFGKIVELIQVLKPCITFFTFQRIFTTDATKSTVVMWMMRHIMTREVSILFKVWGQLIFLNPLN